MDHGSYNKYLSTSVSECSKGQDPTAMFRHEDATDGDATTYSVQHFVRSMMYEDTGVRIHDM
jgi:hypothetical protein